MPSPFPGMDPYLEDPAFWSDFHTRFITYLSDYLTDHLPEPYEARIGETVNLIQMSPEIVKLVYPDVGISKGSQGTGKTLPETGTLLLEPVTIPHEFLEEVHETHVEILHRPERSLVAILEVLSPSNKTGDGFQEFRTKRKTVLQQKVHLLELDLLKGGNRLPLLKPLPPGDYYAFLSRVEDRPNCHVYSWTVRQPFPAIPIPLRAPDPDLIIDLGAVFKIVYERGRYRRSLAYDQPPPAPLSAEDQRWARQEAALAKE